MAELPKLLDPSMSTMLTDGSFFVPRDEAVEVNGDNKLEEDASLIIYMIIKKCKYLELEF